MSNLTTGFTCAFLNLPQKRKRWRLGTMFLSGTHRKTVKTSVNDAVGWPRQTSGSCSALNIIPIWPTMTSHSAQLFGKEYTHQWGWYAKRHNNAIFWLKLPHFPMRRFLCFSQLTMHGKLPSRSHVNPNITKYTFYNYHTSNLASVAPATSTCVTET